MAEPPSAPAAPDVAGTAGATRGRRHHLGWHTGTRHAQHARRSGLPGGDGRAPFPLGVVAVAVCTAIGVVGLLATFGDPQYVFTGDQALLAMRVVDALGLHALLGPYSRFGWSHPGPALFYLTAPVYAGLGRNPRSLFVAAMLLNGGCAVATVAVVRRQAGEWASRWAAAVVCIYLLAAGLLAVESFWNPYLVAGPVLLVLVLAAAAASGSWLSLVGLLLAGSYAVQTDVGTAPVVLFAGVLGAVGLLVSRVRDRRRRRRTLPSPGTSVVPARWQRAPVVLGVLGLVGLVVMWLPPILQQLGGTGQPHNLSAMFDFFLHPPPARTIPGGVHHSWSVAVNAVSAASTSVPFGSDPTARTIATANTGHVLAMVAWMLVALVAAVVAVRRRRRFELALAVASLLSLPVALVATTRIAGPVYPYLLSWAGLLPVPGLLAAGSLAAGWAVRRIAAGSWSGPPLTAARYGAAAVLLAPVAVLAWHLAFDPPSAHDNGDPSVTRLASFARAHLPPGAGRPVVEIASLDRWPVTTGLVLQLERDGVDAVVTPQWGFMFTGRDVVSGSPRWEIVVSPGTSTSASAAGSGTGGATLTVDTGQFGPTTIEVRPVH